MSNKVNIYIEELIKNYVPTKHTLTPDLLYKYFRALPIYYDANQYHYKSVSFSMFRNKDGIIIYPEFRPAINIPFTQLKSLLNQHINKPVEPLFTTNQMSIFDFMSDVV